MGKRIISSAHYRVSAQRSRPRAQTEIGHASLCSFAHHGLATCRAVGLAKAEARQRSTLRFPHSMHGFRNRSHKIDELLG